MGNIGRPRRGKGLLITKKDTRIGPWYSVFKPGESENDCQLVDLEYNTMKDMWAVKVRSEDEGDGGGFKNNYIYEGWNSAFTSRTKDPELERLEQIKAFSANHPVDSKRVATWCINISLTHMFLEGVQLIR